MGKVEKTDEQGKPACGTGTVGHQSLGAESDESRQDAQLASLSGLAGDIAHGLNNLLTIIGGYGTLVHDALPPGQPAAEDMRKVLVAADRAALLTRQLMIFSFEETRRPQVVDINHLVMGLGDRLRRLLRDEVVMRIVLGPGVCLVKADPRQIEYVLLCLVQNGAEAMAQGGTLTIETRPAHLAPAAGEPTPAASGAYAVLSVSDTRPSPTPEAEGRPLKAFAVAGESSQAPSLSLNECFTMVRENGGFVDVDSGAVQGTTVRIHLPCYTEAGALTHPEHSPHPVR